MNRKLVLNEPLTEGSALSVTSGKDSYIIMLGGGRQRELLCERDALFMKRTTTEGCICPLLVEAAG